MRMDLFRTWTRKFEATNRLLDRIGKNPEDAQKTILNNNQRPAGLQQPQAQQQRLAVKADAFKDKKTRESREDFARNGRFKDI